MIRSELAAAHFRKGRLGGHPPRFIVIHTAECLEVEGAALAVAKFFHDQPANTANPTSAHVVADDANLVRMVADADTAYAAGPTANTEGLHLEQAGKAGWTAAQWATLYTEKELAVDALQVAEWCHVWRIPAIRLTVAELRDGVSRGIVGHVDCTAAWHETTHTDPGAHYPWDDLLARVQAILTPPRPTNIYLEDPPMRGIVTYHRAGHVNAEWSVELIDGVAYLRWIVDPVRRNNLVAAGVPRITIASSALDAFPVVGALPPVG